MLMRAPLIPLVLVAALVTASLHAQDPKPRPQEPQQRPPTFKSGINFVRVDVIVSD